MDSNIRTGGEPVKESISTEEKATVAWINFDDYKLVGGTPEEWGENGNWDKGPITAMDYLEEAKKSEVANNTDAKSYLYANIGANESSGYWVLSSHAAYPDNVWTVSDSGFVVNYEVSAANFFGVRPVINLKL